MTDFQHDIIIIQKWLIFLLGHPVLPVNTHKQTHHDDSGTTCQIHSLNVRNEVTVTLLRVHCTLVTAAMLEVHCCSTAISQTCVWLQWLCAKLHQPKCHGIFSRFFSFFAPVKNIPPTWRCAFMLSSLKSLPQIVLLENGGHLRAQITSYLHELRKYRGECVGQFGENHTPLFLL